VSILTDAKLFQPTDYNIYKDYFTTVLRAVHNIEDEIVQLIRTKTKPPTRKIQELVNSTVRPVQVRFIYRYLMLWYLEKYANLPEEKYVI